MKEAIIFCGIQATGKTTFYKENFFKSHVHISLDLLKTRNREQQFLQLCIQTQQSFVVDNTNPTYEERKKYIVISKENKFKVIGYYFHSKVIDSIKRNENRKGKEFIPDIAIKGTYRKLEILKFDEGFDELYFVEIYENNFLIKKWKNEI